MTREVRVRKLIMWNLFTLDGYFEGEKKWDLAWHELVWGEELERFSIEQLRQVDLLLFGRVTYEGMAAYWSSAQGEVEVAKLMNRIPKIVFSNSLGAATWANTRLIRGSAEAEVASLKSQPGGDMYVFGSAKLCASLTRRGLIDEYRLCLVPVMIGGGTPLFKPGAAGPKLNLVESRPLASGGVILRYGATGT